MDCRINVPSTDELEELARAMFDEVCPACLRCRQRCREGREKTVSLCSVILAYAISFSMKSETRDPPVDCAFVFSTAQAGVDHEGDLARHQFYSFLFQHYQMKVREYMYRS